MTQWGLVAVDPSTGTRLWGYAFPYSTSTGASPVVAGDVVYCSAGYDVGAGAVRVTYSGGSWSAVQLWRKPGQLMNHWSTPVHHEGFLYGLYGHADYGTAPLKCVDVATGEEKWSHDGFGPGGVMAAGSVLVVLSDAGELVLVKADPTGYRELARQDALAGKCWGVPALSDGRLYARSTSEGVCLDVAAAVPLALGPVVRTGGGTVQLEARRADGLAMSDQDAAGLAFWATPNLSLTDWVRLPGTAVVTGGRATLNDPAAATERQRFYRVSSNP
jgi:outer membrane protein assembly factor BamB